MQTKNKLRELVTDRAPKEEIGYALAEYVAEEIVGQCQYSFEHYIEQAQEEIPGLQAVNNHAWEMDDAFCGPFDEKAFCCDTCGWWCSTDELNNETSDALCDDCNIMENGDEDG